MTLWSVMSIFCAIGNAKLVTGSTKFFTPTGYFDLTMLQPGVGNPNVMASTRQQHEDATQLTSHNDVV